MKHFTIYFDSAGCFEIIAESYEVIPEQPGKLSRIIELKNCF
jgi:hypothetical protein